MSKIQAFLERLQGVRCTGGGRYIARCPAHEDRSPSLSIKETSSGDILFHCFAGCSFGDVIAALGMRASDCFAATEISTAKYRRQDRAHARVTEVEMLQCRYGLTLQYAKSLVIRRIERDAEETR